LDKLRHTVVAHDVVVDVLVLAHDVVASTLLLL
jgi:hypothetical protein